MADGSSRLPTTAEKIQAEFEARKKPFRKEQKTHYSTRPVVWSVIGTGYPTAAIAWAYLDASSIVDDFFRYGQGDSIETGFGNQVQATACDTDLLAGGKTVGDETFVIQGISLSKVAVRVKQSFPNDPAPPTAIANALAGGASLVDPGSIFMPPQLYSPANLEDAILTAMTPAISVSLNWDQEHVYPLGTLEFLGQGGPKSFLRSNGEPHPSNIYKIPEGYVWRPAGKTDSNFSVKASVGRKVAVPLSLVTLPGQSSPQSISGLVTDLTVCLHGTKFSYPTSN